jgi:DNA topoisomerase-1
MPKATPKKKASPKNSPEKHLVIVESPAKAKTIGRFLGKNYTVKASMGHVRDLPSGKLGVDIENAFAPDYVIIKGKKTIIGDLKKAAKGVASVYLATDPDREGEAISWHLKEAAGWTNIPVRRVVFHQITPEAVKEAFENDRDIDMGLVNAQQARRILDRLVGYQLSPLLWRKVQRGLSAGRVQSIALRMVTERDHEISLFIPTEYWSLEATLSAEGTSGTFTPSLYRLAEETTRITLPNHDSVASIQTDLEGAQYTVSKVTRRESHRRPSAPFITSSLQQEAWRRLRFSPRKTMTVAQQLYEGLSVGDEGSVGLITYMRTDSPQVAESAITETREYIANRYGKEYIPAAPRRYTSRSKVAQEAHEAIRPTGVQRDPESMRQFLNRDLFLLYDLVWKRMVASQMSDTLLDSTQLETNATGKSDQTYVFRASGSVVKFPGFRTLYMEALDEQPKETQDTEATDDQPLNCVGLTAGQHFTEPPAHYTEATLIRGLEEKGIGRPSTYAPIISTLTDRHYATREKGRLEITRLGEVVNDQLTGHFPDIMDPDFTANLEERLDDVANGKQEWVPLLADFYTPFAEALERAQEEMPRIRIEEPTDEVCEECDRPMVIKHGRFGQFLSCSGFPDCRNSRPLLQKTGARCPKCANGDLVQRRGKGRTFYGCSTYPACDFTVSQRPLQDPCPECDGLLVAAGRDNAKCTNCVYRGPLPEQEPAAVT